MTHMERRAPEPPVSEHDERIIALGQLGARIGKSPTAAQLYTLATALHHIGIETLRIACDRLARTCDFFPSEKAIREACAVHLKQLEMQREDQARKQLPEAPVSAEKLDEFMRQIRKRIGRMDMPSAAAGRGEA